MIQSTPATLVRALSVAPFWFVAAMANGTTARYALPLLAVGVAWAAWRGELDLVRPLDAIEWGLIQFVAVWALSVACGIDPARSLRLSIAMLAALTCLFALRRYRDPAPAIAAFDAALFLLGLWECLQLALPLASGLRGEAAIQASNALWLVEPNDIGWIAATWPPLLAWRWRGNTRLLLALPIALGVLAMLVLESRLALLAAVLALAPMLARTASRALLLAAGLAGAFVVGALVVDPAIFAKGSASFAARLQLWQAAGRVFFDYPWIGAGPYGFPLAYTRYLPAALAVDPRATPWPHSLPLEIAATMGLAGILASGLLILLVGIHGRSVLAGDGERRRVVMVQLGVFTLLGLFEASFLRLWVWMLATSLLCRLSRHAGLSSPAAPLLKENAQ